MKKTLTILLAAFLFGSLGALQVKNEALKNRGMFAISFKNGASIYMKARTIASISKQEYYIGFLQVSEVVIESEGGVSQIRIYHSATVDPADVARKAAQKDTSGTADKFAAATEYANRTKAAVESYSKVQTKQKSDAVYKEYPATTHSKTLEFVVDDLGELEALYEALIIDYAGALVPKAKATEAATKLPQENALGGKLFILE